MDSNSNERKNNILLNSETILNQIKETSATEVLNLMRQSFQNDSKWTEELRNMAKSCFVVAMSTSLLTCNLFGDEEVLDTLAKAIDDREAMIDLLYPFILRALNESR